MDRIKEFVFGYYDQTMTWYSGLSQVMQFWVLFGVFVAIALSLALYMLSRITR